MKKYINIIIGCLLIALSYNLFFEPYNLISNSTIGLSSILNNLFSINVSYYLLIINLIFLLISLPFLKLNQIYKYLIPSLLIPLFIFISDNISQVIKFDNIELIIIAVFGAGLTGLGCSMIYKEGYSLGGIDILSDLFKKYNHIISYIIDFIIVIITLILFNIESSIYTIIIVLIIKYLSTKAKLGINSNKSFFIITTKEKEVKDYLINELHYDYTEFNVKGGFTSQKNKIIMTVIDTEDYFKLKEGIFIIDPKAFISIIDNYETINKNLTINSQNTNE